MSIESPPQPSLHVRALGLRSYIDVWSEMQQFTNERDEHTQDELWLVQHFPVFTQGQAGKVEHVLNPGDIPIIKSDRGGQVTYHGPGQIVAYPLLNLRRLKFGVRELVTRLENSVVTLLEEWGIESSAKPDAPGVYIQGKKIASLGLRVRRGCSFHGVSLNAKMDLEPFLRINPCGYNGLQMAQLADYVSADKIDIEQLEKQFAESIAKAIGFSNIVYSK